MRLIQAVLLACALAAMAGATPLPKRLQRKLDSLSGDVPAAVLDFLKNNAFPTTLPGGNEVVSLQHLIGKINQSAIYADFEAQHGGVEFPQPFPCVAVIHIVDPGYATKDLEDYFQIDPVNDVACVES